MINFKDGFIATKKVLDKNSPTILTGLAVAGVVTTTILAVKATPKVLDILEKDLDVKQPLPSSLGLTEEEYYNRMDVAVTMRGSYKHARTIPDIIKLTWKPYVPAMVMGAVTITCIIGANKISLRRNAAIAGLYSVTESTLKEYQEHVKERMGETKEAKIREDMAQEEVKRNPIKGDNVIIVGNGGHLMYDTYSGRYFRSDIEKIRQAVNDVNQYLLNDMFMWADLNNFYERIGLKPIKAGDDLGWNTDDMLDVTFEGVITEDSEPCIALVYEVRPRTDFR